MPAPRRLTNRRHAVLRAVLALALAGSLSVSQGAGIDDPIHGYYEKAPRDRFTKLKAELEAGTKALDTSGELPFLQSLLRELQVPVSSQMLVYSVTSLQKNLVSPRRPRALYFNDDTYVGFVPGGRLEVISLDPELGGIFYIFDRLRGGAHPRAERSEDCMSCHAPRHLDFVPGLVIESVVPGVTGGGEKAFRRERTGHDIPFEERFGGWHLTGANAFPQRWANILMEYTDAGRQERTIMPGDISDISRYLLPTSELLPQLLHEHQVGFVNRAMRAMYGTRSLLHANGGNKESISKELDELARGLTRYLLFAEEMPIKPGSISTDVEYRAAFEGLPAPKHDGRSLRDLDLGTRLLRYRCSYMIYSPAFTGLQPDVRDRVYEIMAGALHDQQTEPGFEYLQLEERRAIREILAATLPEWPGRLTSAR